VRAPTVPLIAAIVVSAATAAADPPVCAPPGTLACPVYERFENKKFGFTVDVPSFFTRKPADADGRGQPFEYAGKARIRAWAMYDNPPMTVEQLYGDWTRRDGVSFKTLAGNTWVVRGKDGGRLYYSRSILADGIISTIEVTYTPEIADAFEPILLRLGTSLMTEPGVGARSHPTH
jgi:hypothetical protein